MLKKIAELIYVLFIGAIWTFIFLPVADFVMRGVWNFDMLSLSSWKFIGNYWNSGGRIIAGKDYLFISSLIILLPLWIWGWRLCLKHNPLNILFFPITLYNNYIANKYGDESSRIIFKNMGVSKKKSINDIINEKMKKPQEKSSQANDIRQSIQNKIQQTKD